jgi:protein-disulfide isomerase
VTSTPTFFVNGIKIVGGLRPQFFDAAIAYELQRAPAGAEKP